MHRAIILVTSLSCLAFSECQPGKVSLESDTADTNANFWCGFYASTVVYGQITELCGDELNTLDEASSDAFYDRAIHDVLGACTDYVNNSTDPEAIEFVVKYVCRNGYDEESVESTAAFEELTCSDVLTASYLTTWPYEGLCPCIATGAVALTGDVGAATCIE